MNRLQTIVIAATFVSLTSGLPAGPRVYRIEGFRTHGDQSGSPIAVSVSRSRAVFSVEDPDVSFVQLVVLDETDHTTLYDSGPQMGTDIAWDFGTNALVPAVRFRLQAWNSWNESLGIQVGTIRHLDASTTEPSVEALSFDDPDNFTVAGSLGVGTDTPERAVHLKGPNAVFRMDRSQDSAAFMLVRTDGAGNPLKNFVVGVNAAGLNNGEFIINDLGTSVGGGGTRRMTIDNSGNVDFAGTVTAAGYFQTSSLRFKTNVRTLEDPLGLVDHLRGVRFNWKASGEPSVGVIAEEVATVLPEAVSWEANGSEAAGVNYDSLVAVLLEATKDQQKKIENLDREIDRLASEIQEELGKARTLRR